MRAIDADALEELFREVIGGIAKKPEMNGNLEHMVRASAMVIEMIKDAPTIDPERPTGRWIEAPRFANDAQPNLKCQFCGTEVDWFGCTKFCGECGAKLRLKLEVEYDCQ